MKARIPKPVRWLFVFIALLAGWLAGDLLDHQTAAKDLRSAPAPGPMTQPAE